MNKLISCISVILLACVLWSCSFGEAPKNRLVVTGSSTIAPLIVEISKRFEKKYPHIRVDVQTGGSSRGISDVRRGLSQIGMVSRSLKDKEKDIKGYSLARDGVGIIVHRNNPISSLSHEQILAIYTGAIDNWSQLGGTDKEIVVVNKAEGRSTLEVFLDFFQLKNSRIVADIIIGDNEQGIKTVSGNPSAIAYVSIGSVEYGQATGVAVKLIKLGGVDASSQTVANGQYPLSRDLNLVTTPQPDSLSQQFIDFATSGEVEDLIQDQSFVASSV